VRSSTMKRKFSSIVVTAAMVAAGLGVAVLAAPAASADPGPVLPITATMPTADALPTTQIDGVAWTQQIVTNTVYVGGKFANARPAGAAAGTSLTPRANMLSYNLSTGVLNTGFNPAPNNQVYAIAPSPDGKRIYIGGTFTTVGGVTRNRIAAVDATTGAVITTFAAGADFTVKAIVATNTTVYVAGAFSNANSTSRTRFAAFNATNGALMAWAPTADATVNAMVLSPDGAIIAGGAFANVNGSPAYGLAKINATSGALLAWNATNLIRNAGANSAILSLKTDGQNIFGSGYTFGSGGNLEGAFSADPATGNINYVEDCHGDSYDVWPGAEAFFTVSHDHYCGNIGGFPQSDPWSVNQRHALAYSKRATGTAAHDPYGYYDYYGTPTPSLVHWFPEFTVGSYTGKSQAAWSITGNSQYIVLGGEFPSVNGLRQQGLVRFAVKPIGSGKMGPQLSGSAINPTINSVAGKARVAWQANTDEDSPSLTYTLTRNGAQIYQASAASNFWTRPTMGYIDSSVVPGTTYKYRLSVADPDGNTVQSDIVSWTAPASSTQTAYAQRVIADGAAPYWPMNESSGTVLFDNVGFNDADTGAGVTRGTAGAIASDTATTFDGATSAGTRTAVTSPDTFTAQAWINTTTTSGGKILGFGNAPTGSSSSYDRHIYMDNAGHVFFGVYPGFTATVNSAGTYNDGQWHQISVSLGSDGMKLYVDDKLVGQRADVTSGQPFSGYWRVGGDNLNGWPSRSSQDYFAGAIDEVAIYPTVLSPQTVDAQWVAAGRSSTMPVAPANQAPTAAFTLTKNGLEVSVDGTSSADPDGNVASYAWSFGDGGAATGVTASHTYAAAGTFTVTLTVTDNQGATATKSADVSVAKPNQAPTASFTVTTSQLTGNFDASGSTDPDGTIASYAWDFGDNTMGTGKTVSRNYTAAGTYPVTLTVTDDLGATKSTTQNVSVTSPPPNTPPNASFTVAQNDLTVNVQSTSSDPDPGGSIVATSWAFGDGASSTNTAATHTYTTAGTYQITLTVKDNSDATSSKTTSVMVTAAPTPNKAPTAAFTSSVSGLTASLNASGSSDSDGTITRYAWDYGDATTAVTPGSTATHDYAAAGTYTVKLTVTDNGGATATASHDVTVSSPAPAALIKDTFGRTTSGGWGSADTGGAWTVAGGASNFSISGGVGQVKLAAAGAGPSATIGAPSSADVDIAVDTSMDKAATGGGVYLQLDARKVGNSEYRTTVKLLATGAVQIQLVKVVNGTSTTLKAVTVSGLTYVAGDSLTTRLRVSGGTSVALSAKVWRTGTTEPAAWTVAATDAAGPLSTTGSIALSPYLSGSSTNAPVVVRYDNLTVSGVAP
jgi:PKD repeat protein